jgi:pyridoxine 4-dehydrogenase
MVWAIGRPDLSPRDAKGVRPLGEADGDASGRSEAGRYAGLVSAAPTTFRIGGELVVRRMGFGAMRITGAGILGWPEDRENALRVLRRAVELGVNLIDTADSYGPEVSELLIAEALHPYRDGLVVATKGGLLRDASGAWTRDGRPEHLRQACEASLRRLRLDRIELYQLHAVDRNVPFEESVGELARLREEGKIGYVGLSNVSVDLLRRARELVPVVSVQNRYNLVDREADGVIDECEREAIMFLPWYPLAVGDFARPQRALGRVASARGVTPAQIALAWLLARAPVVVPIPGTASVAHLEENVAALEVELTDDERAELS